MRVRYQADNDLRKAIVRGAVRREPRMDFRSAQAARLDGIHDQDVLALAADDGRILVSHDFDTMAEHFRLFTRAAVAREPCWLGKTCRSVKQSRRCR